MTLDNQSDRRIRRTRHAIFTAFRELVFQRRYDEIRTSDLIEAADIGKTTFYQHFKNKDDVLINSIEPLFDILTSLTTSQYRIEEVDFLLGHFWEQRAFARIIFQTELFFKLSRKLSEMLELKRSTQASEGVADPAPKSSPQSIAIASFQLGLIKSWLAAEVTISRGDLREYLIKTTQAMAMP